MTEKRQRKSLSALRPPLLNPLTPIKKASGSSSPVSLLSKRRALASQFPVPDVPSPTVSDVPSPVGSETAEVKRKPSIERLVQRARPRSLQKSARPSSIFGSWRSLSSVEDEEIALDRAPSQPSPVCSHPDFLSELAVSQVLLHGDIQTASGVFRKKSQYLVLTENHLVKIRSQSRASEIFPSIPSSMGRAAGVRHSRLSSNGSVHDLSTQGEAPQAIPLNHVVAVYRLDDGKPYFSIEISYIDEGSLQASNLILQLHDPREHDLWLSSIRGAAMNSRLKKPLLFPRQWIEYTARLLEQDADYDPNQMHMFRAVQRASKSGTARSSSDDLSKLTSNICILAVGVFKIHIIPLPKGPKTMSSTSLTEFTGSSHGIASLTEFTVAQDDDAFMLKFRLPLRQPQSIYLASSCVTDVALSFRRTAEFLRPKWPEQPFTWNVPKIMDEDFLPMPPIDEEHDALDRTLSAYCVAYGLDASLICYTVDTACEDGPAFHLGPKQDGGDFSVLELLAIFRALRYNESFGILSFAGTNLNDLQRLRDPFGYEHVAWRTRSGEQLKQHEEINSTLLVQEVRAIALNSVSLRRVDFSYCLNVKSSTRFGKDEDTGCGVCEGIFPMRARHATNIDWIILHGIALSETDIDYLFSAAIDQSCHFRAVDVGDCSLNERSLHTVLNALSHQGATLESLDISGNPARVEPDSLNLELLSYNFLRKIKLSNICKTSGAEALLNAENLIRWRLEEIDLSKTSLNEQSVDAIAVYLQSPQSETLRLLNLDRCQLTGSDVATLFESSQASPDSVRGLRMNVSSNRLGDGHDALVESIRRGMCPSQIVMQMIDYHDEGDFRRLLDAFTINTSVDYLDVSKVTLPSDATKTTCESLGRLLAFNCSMRYLDVSGEQTHLVASAFGPGLNSALIGLKHNSSLETLRIENQRLGLQGASTLASVLESNKVLRELRCENNEINLQAFTVLVNSCEHNQTLLCLSSMAKDRAWAQKKVDREIDNMRDNANLGLAAMSSTKATVKRTLGRTMTGQRSNNHPRASQGPRPADMEAVMGSLSDQWDHEVARLQDYLARNNNLLNGFSPMASEGSSSDRLGADKSLEKGIKDLSLEKTPKAELNRQLGEQWERSRREDMNEISDQEAEEADGPLEIGKV